MFSRRLPRIATVMKSLLISTALGFATAPSASAQNMEPKASGTALPEVTVSAGVSHDPTTEGSGSYTTGAMTTATGLGLSIRDTPQSVSVVTRERIEDQGLESITDVINNVTGVSAKVYDSARSGFSARGFDITNLQIDGIPTTWDAGWSAGETQTDTTIYDHVEVVRGATGLLSGTGNPGAAINLVRKHATSKVFTGAASLGFGSWNNYRGTADLSTPLTQDGRIRGRVVASYQDQDSYVDLTHNRKSILYGVIDADLAPDTLLSVGASRQQNTPQGSTWGGLSPWYSDGSRTNWDRSKTTAADWSSWSSIDTTYFANLDHRFGNDWKVRVALNHGEYDGSLKLLYLSGSPDRTTGLGLSAFPAYYQTTRNQDDAGVHVSGPFRLWGRKHELAFGLLHSEQKFDATSRNALTTRTVGDFNQWNGSYPEPTWSAASPYENFKTEQTAAYAVGRFTLAAPLKLIIGSRISDWKTAGQNWSGPYRFDYNHKITPYAGLIYDLNATYSAYASYTSIFQPQNNQDRNGKYLDPITGKSYEIGIKGELLDGKLNTAFALFRIKQNNLAQADAGQLVPGTVSQAYYAAQGATSDGYEIDVSGELRPRWSMALGWTQFHASDASGQPVNTNHPRRMLKAFTKYRLNGNWNRLTLGGGVNWEAANYTLTTNPVLGTPGKLEQPAYALVNLMARYEFSKALSAQLNINNVFDKTYYSQIGFYDQLAYGAPRNATLSLQYRF